MWKYFSSGLTADASLMGGGSEWGRKAKGRKILGGVQDVQLTPLLSIYQQVNKDETKR
jgi:hypothetical protein